MKVEINVLVEMDGSDGGYGRKMEEVDGDLYGGGNGRSGNRGRR